jgi:polar amino acid transport system permease protein
MTTDWGVVVRGWDLLMLGMRYTIVFTIATSVLGLIIGSLLALGRLSTRRPLRIVSTVVLEVVRGIPLLPLLIWVYYALPIFFGIRVSPAAAAIFGLSLYGGAYYGEIVRGGILSIDDGQTQAALSLGMTYNERMRRIILPQAFKRMVPPLVGQTIIQLKNTSLASVVTVGELLYQAQVISARTYRPFEVYTAVAGLYLVLVIPLAQFARRLEIRSERYGSEVRG